MTLTIKGRHVKLSTFLAGIGDQMQLMADLAEWFGSDSEGPLAGMDYDDMTLAFKQAVEIAKEYEKQGERGEP